MWEEAIAAAEKGAPPGLYGYLLGRSGQREEANRVLQTLIASYQRTGRDAFGVVAVYAGLGDFDRAFAWLDRSFDDGSAIQSHFNLMEPIFEELRSDPRFGPVKERLGIQNR